MGVEVQVWQEFGCGSENYNKSLLVSNTKWILEGWNMNRFLALTLWIAAILCGSSTGDGFAAPTQQQAASKRFFAPPSRLCELAKQNRFANNIAIATTKTTAADLLA